MSFLQLSTRRALQVAPRQFTAVRTATRVHKPSAPPPPTENDNNSASVPHEKPRDESTSAFSPMVTLSPEEHIHDGIIPAGIVSGAPVDLQTRTVRIYKPAKAATQSGTWKQHQWRLDWDVLSKGHRWENGLMGWQSSGDFVQGTNLSFSSKEDAIYFAEKQGYEWFIQEPKERDITPKAYANNFTWSAKKLKKIHTK